jgi:NitT/TauT family transport system ATP-binding protein
MPGAVVTLRGVGHAFSVKDGETEALRDVYLKIHAGEFVVLIGPSGCGKSTLLHFIAGLDKPEEGEILVDDEPVNGPNPDHILVFQQAALFPWLDTYANVAFGLKQAGVPRRERRERVEQALRLVELQDFMHSRIHELSGGMRQRVALARALVLKPRVLLMDEPFAALDAQVRENLQLHLQRLWENERPTIVFVTHDVREAAVLGDRIVVMTARPGTIKGTIPVELPRPRLVENHAVVDTAAKAREALSGEMPKQGGRWWR